MTTSRPSGLELVTATLVVGGVLGLPGQGAAPRRPTPPEWVVSVNVARPPTGDAPAPTRVTAALYDETAVYDLHQTVARALTVDVGVSRRVALRDRAPRRD